MRRTYENSIYSKRQRLGILQGELRLEAEAFKADWMVLNDYILERRGRFFVTDVDNGMRKSSKIIDSTATLASRTLSSGMMSGVTSPARPWFKLQTDNKELNKKESVKAYFNKTEEEMRSIFLKSNLYNVLPTLYADMGTFGTGCIFMEEDDETVVRFTSYPLGSYQLANDRKGRARVFSREFQMSVRQLVDEFARTNERDMNYIDWSKLSQNVRSLYESHNLETRIDVCHVVQPNHDYRPGALESKYKKFSSDYYEKGADSYKSQSGGAVSSGYNNKFLREKGYDYFPALAVRWETTGEDSYGSTCPGSVCIGSVKALQLGEKRIAAAIDQKVKPSMIGPSSLKSHTASILPGDITYMDERDGTKGFRKLFEIDFDVRELEGKQEQLRQQIRKAYYEDLFLMMAQSDRREITATEVEERHEEKLLALGPVLERMNLDLLDPLIENTYSIMERRELLDEPPEELTDLDYNIEYVSIMAQAQKIAGIGNIERFAGFVGQMASLDPEMVKKANFEDMIEKYADLLGIPPEMVATKEQMEEFRQASQEAQQQAQQQESMAAAAETGKNLSETKMGDNSVLDQLLG